MIDVSKGSEFELKDLARHGSLRNDEIDTL